MSRNIFCIVSLLIAPTKICPISRAMSKSRDSASRANTAIAGEGSGISVASSLPRYRIIIANLAKGAARAAGCDTSFCSRTRAMPTEPSLTSAVPRPEQLGKIIRRKLILLVPICRTFRGRIRERRVSYFTLRIIIILMEPIKDLYQTPTVPRPVPGGW